MHVPFLLILHVGMKYLKLISGLRGILAVKNILKKAFIPPLSIKLVCMKESLYDLILEFLYEHKDNGEYVNLMKQFPQHSDNVIRDKANELARRKLIEPQIETYITILHATDKVAGMNTNPDSHYKAKITFEGEQRVKQLLQERNMKGTMISNSILNVGNTIHGAINQSVDQSVNIKKNKPDSTWRQVILLIAGLVGSLIVAYLVYYFGWN